MVEAMVIQEGFKQTEVGIIPGDWVVKTIGRCLAQNPDYGINAAAVRYNGELPVYLRITDITEDGKYSKKNIVSVNNVDSPSFFLQEGDLVFARTGASVGKTYLYDLKDGKLVFAGFLIRVRANSQLLLPEYLKYFTQTKFYWNWIAANSMRTGQPGINGNEYKELPIPLPPTKAEQAAIATVLNDADALITQLEKLIAKKRAIKQGAMQELLKPKEDWEVKPLEKEIDLLTGFPFPSNQYYNGGVKLLRGSNVKRGVTDWNEENTMYWESITFNLKEYILKEGDIVIAMDGSLVGKSFARLSKKDLPALLLQRVARVRSDKIDMGYLKEFICSDYFTKYCETVKTASAIPHISPKDIKSYKIPIPPTKAEQTRIAQILSDMDTEINALEKKLNKYKMIKQGMMQNLLTGRIRLI